MGADWNAKIIEEFRANEGRVASFAHQPLLLLHHTGARSGEVRVNPVAYQAVGDDWAIFASKGGAPNHPGWYHNLVANPDAVIELGTETVPVRARVADGAERDRIWEEQKKRNPGFAEYESKTSRTIPVVVLTRR